MSGTPSGEGQTFDPQVLGLRDAGQKPVDVEVTSFSEIELEAAKYGVTRADLEAAITKPTPSMQEIYAYIVTRALMAKKDAVSRRVDHKGYPIRDNSEKPKEQPDIYTYLSRGDNSSGGESYGSVQMMRTDERGESVTYSITRSETRGRPTYSADYSGKQKSALPDAEGRNPFGNKLFNPKLNDTPITPSALHWVFSRLGGFPPGFMAPPVETPRSLAEVAK